MLDSCPWGEAASLRAEQQRRRRRLRRRCGAAATSLVTGPGGQAPSDEPADAGGEDSGCGAGAVAMPADSDWILVAGGADGRRRSGGRTVSSRTEGSTSLELIVWPGQTRLIVFLANYFWTNTTQNNFGLDQNLGMVWPKKYRLSILAEPAQIEKTGISKSTYLNDS
jgi:hypothetical protein